MTAQHFLTFSDGSEVGPEEPSEYGIASESPSRFEDHGVEWVWIEGLGTADQAEALALVAARGYTATKIPGGWYGDDRDDSYRLDQAVSRGTVTG